MSLVKTPDDTDPYHEKGSDIVEGSQIVRVIVRLEQRITVHHTAVPDQEGILIRINHIRAALHGLRHLKERVPLNQIPGPDKRQIIIIPDQGSQSLNRIHLRIRRLLDGLHRLPHPIGGFFPAIPLRGLSHKNIDLRHLRKAQLLLVSRLNGGDPPGADPFLIIKPPVRRLLRRMRCEFHDPALLQIAQALSGCILPGILTAHVRSSFRHHLPYLGSVKN